jgi:hypothetical protein
MAMDNLKLVGTFALHICAGTVLLMIVAGAALALHFLTEGLAALGVLYLAYPIAFLEAFVFAIDFVCYVAFCLAEAHILLREIAYSAGWIRRP